MRTQQTLRSILNFGAAAALLSGATMTPCAAKRLLPPPVETGYPAPLINRPVCWTAPNPDSWSPCGARDPYAHRILAPLD
jgi:hypothetical protein